MTISPKTLAISGLIRPLLESRLPEGLDVRWFMTHDEAMAAVAEAEIGWFDMNDQQAIQVDRCAQRFRDLERQVFPGLQAQSKIFWLRLTGIVAVVNLIVVLLWRTFG
jgi:hypothetical protein